MAKNAKIQPTKADALNGAMVKLVMPSMAKLDKVKYISQIQFHKNRHSLLPLVQLSYHTKFVRRQ